MGSRACSIAHLSPCANKINRTRVPTPSAPALWKVTASPLVPFCASILTWRFQCESAQQPPLMRTHACLYLRLPIAQAMATRLEQNRSIVLDLSSSITTVLASVVPQAAVETSRCPNCVATSITSQLLTRVSSCAKRAILRTSRALQSASRLNRQTSRILPLAMMRESRHKDF